MDNKIKLIITEDAMDFTQENIKILQSFNISPVFCNKDGDELCDRIRLEQPDVVLMDSFMTRLDAIGVMRNIKRQNVPAILCYILYLFLQQLTATDIVCIFQSCFCHLPI